MTILRVEVRSSHEQRCFAFYYSNTAPYQKDRLAIPKRCLDFIYRVLRVDMTGVTEEIVNSYSSTLFSRARFSPRNCVFTYQQSKIQHLMVQNQYHRITYPPTNTYLKSKMVSQTTKPKVALIGEINPGVDAKYVEHLRTLCDLIVSRTGMQSQSSKRVGSWSDVGLLL